MLKILNLGCGPTKIPNAINIDVYKFSTVDKVINLSQIPWYFLNETIDGIYMIHSLEHFKDYQAVILECHRILRKGGFLHIKTPHSSSVSGLGCFGHYHTFSYNTFDDYLTREFYQYQHALFRTEFQKINYFGFKPSKWYKEEGREVTKLMKFLIPIDHIMSFIINLYPPFYEKVLHNWIGDAAEVEWRGIKI